MLIQHNQEKRAISPDPFPFCGWGLGTRLGGRRPGRFSSRDARHERHLYALGSDGAAYGAPNGTKTIPPIILPRVIRREQQSRSLDAHPIRSTRILKARVPERTRSLDVFTKNDTYVASANAYVTKGTLPANTHRICGVLLRVTLETFYDVVIMI